MKQNKILGILTGYLNEEQTRTNAGLLSLMAVGAAAGSAVCALFTISCYVYIVFAFLSLSYAFLAVALHELEQRFKIRKMKAGAV